MMRQNVVNIIDWVVISLSGVLFVVGLGGILFALVWGTGSARRPVASAFSMLQRARILALVLAAALAASQVLRLQVLWGPQSPVLPGGYHTVTFCRFYTAITYGAIEPGFLLVALFACYYAVPASSGGASSSSSSPSGGGGPTMATLDSEPTKGALAPMSRRGRPNLNILFLATLCCLPILAIQIIASLFTRIFHQFNYARSRTLRIFFAAYLNASNNDMAAHCNPGSADGGENCAFCTFPLLSTLASATFDILYLLVFFHATQRISSAAISRLLLRRVRFLQGLTAMLLAASTTCRGLTQLFLPWEWGFEMLRLGHVVLTVLLATTICYILVLKPVYDAAAADWKMHNQRRALQKSLSASKGASEKRESGGPPTPPHGSEVVLLGGSSSCQPPAGVGSSTAGKQAYGAQAATMYDADLELGLIEDSQDTSHMDEEERSHHRAKSEQISGRLVEQQQLLHGRALSTTDVELGLRRANDTFWSLQQRQQLAGAPAPGGLVGSRQQRPHGPPPGGAAPVEPVAAVPAGTPAAHHPSGASEGNDQGPAPSSSRGGSASGQALLHPRAGGPQRVKCSTKGSAAVQPGSARSASGSAASRLASLQHGLNSSPSGKTPPLASPRHDLAPPSLAGKGPLMGEAEGAAMLGPPVSKASAAAAALHLSSAASTKPPAASTAGHFPSHASTIPPLVLPQDGPGPPAAVSPPPLAIASIATPGHCAMPAETIVIWSAAPSLEQVLSPSVHSLGHPLGSGAALAPPHTPALSPAAPAAGRPAAPQGPAPGSPPQSTTPAAMAAAARGLNHGPAAAPAMGTPTAHVAASPGHLANPNKLATPLAPDPTGGAGPSSRVGLESEQVASISKPTSPSMAPSASGRPLQTSPSAPKAKQPDTSSATSAIPPGGSPGDAVKGRMAVGRERNKDKRFAWGRAPASKKG